MNSSIIKVATVVIGLILLVITVVVFVSADAPSIEINSPVTGRTNTPQSAAVDVEIAISGGLMLDVKNLAVVIDGTDITSNLKMVAGHLVGSIVLANGQHNMQVMAGNRLGSVATTELDFVVRGRKSTLQALQAANDSAVFEPRFGVNGVAQSIGPGDAAPECSFDGRLTNELGQSMAKCFLARNAALLSGGEASQDASRIRVTQVSSNPDGGGAVKMRQFVGELPVANSAMTLMLAHGRVIHAGGNFVPAAMLPDFDPRVEDNNREAVLRDAQAQWRTALQIKRRYFSKEETAAVTKLKIKRRYFSIVRGAAVTEFAVEPENGITLAFDERTREIFADYVDGASDIVRPVPRLEYGLDNSVSGQAWINAPLTPTDMQEIRMQGEPTDCNNGQIATAIDNNSTLMMGGASIGFNFNVPCEDPDPNVTNEAGLPPTNNLDSIGLAAGNLGFWLEDLARFANHSTSDYNNSTDFPWSNWFPRVLKIHLYRKLVETKPVPVAVPVQDAINSETNVYWPEDNDVVGGNHTSLRTIAHEYGHHIAYSYGYSAHLGGGLHVTEGWANHNVLRYGLFRLRERNLVSRPFDPVSVQTPGYFTTMVDEDSEETDSPYNTSMGPSHEQRLRRGEFVPGGRRGNDELMLYDFFEGNPYRGSHVIGMIYWELVWNRIRTSFFTDMENDVIFPGCGIGAGGVPDAMTPVNRAFTRAIQLMPQFDGTEHWEGSVVEHVKTFMDFVMAGFLVEQGQAPCNVTQEDVERVASVMAHHCLGPLARYCDDSRYVILPEQRYAVEASPHASYVAGQSQHLVTGAQFQLRDGAWQAIPSGISNEGTFVHLDGGTAFFTVTVTNPGFHRLHLAIESTDSTNISVVAGSVSTNTSLPGATARRWVAPIEISLPAGTTAISITEEDTPNSNSDFRLLAALLDGECTPRVCGGSVCGLTDDGCRHPLQCADCTLLDLGWLDCDLDGTPETEPGDPQKCGGCTTVCPTGDRCLYDTCESAATALVREVVSGRVDNTDGTGRGQNMVVPGLGGFLLTFPGSNSFDISDIKTGVFLPDDSGGINPSNIIQSRVFEVGLHDGTAATSFDYSVVRQELPENTLVRGFDGCSQPGLPNERQFPETVPAGYVPVLLGFDLNSAFVRPINHIRAELFERQGNWWFGYALRDSDGGESLCFRVAYGLVPESRTVGAPVELEGPGPRPDISIGIEQAVLQGFELTLANSKQVHLKSVMIIATSGNMTLAFGDIALADPFEYRVRWVGVQ